MAKRKRQRQGRPNRGPQRLRDLSGKVKQNLMDDLELVGLEPEQRTFKPMDLAWDRQPDDEEARDKEYERLEVSAKRLLRHEMVYMDEDGFYQPTDEGYELVQLMTERHKQREAQGPGSGTVKFKE